MQVTTYQNRAVSTVVTSRKTTDVFVPNARSIAELESRILENSASTSDIALYLRTHGKTLRPCDLPKVQYSIARARYRENKTVTLEQIGMLCQQSVDQIKNHLRQLGFELQERFEADIATRVLFRAMD